MFSTALRSNGDSVVTANAVVGNGTDDRRLLEYRAQEGYMFVTHGQKDFGGTVGDAINHAGIGIDTDPVFPRSDRVGAGRTLDLILERYSASERIGGGSGSISGAALRNAIQTANLYRR